ncbi:MAG: polysaccharide biosynthesis C-terminal domain-containing protein [Candidatus Nanoarchaeia archaeon]|nr:polysaccharide biosynthesis C-terminal domain-containing protein [Candidatus Nanoarchaeia archaeon]MDD5587590.1 polysaccharide biosynthesis C-terminal domain-containing protein [Candidatus Nanoarchaeia archaeon]
MEKGKKEIVYIFGLGWLSKFITYLLLLVLANYYAVSSYGKISFVLSIFNLVLFFSVMGLPNLLVPWMINKKDVSSVFYFLIILNVIFFIAGLFISISYSWVLPFVIALPFLLFNGIGSAILCMQYKYHLLRFFNLAWIIITLIFVFLLKDLDKLGITLGYSLGYLFSSLGIIYLTRKELLKIILDVKLKFPVVFEYIKKGLIISIIAVSVSIMGWIDTIILGALSTFENVAKYGIASAISNIVPAIPAAISLFLLTRISELKNSKRSKNILNRASRISYSFSLLLTIFIASIMPLLIKIFFPKYIGIEVYAIILSIGMLFFTFWILSSTYLSGKLEPGKSLFSIVAAASLNIILDIVLIPKYGLFGICFATLLANILAFTLLSLKIGHLKNFIWVYPLSFTILLAYYLKYYGLILILLVIPLLFLLKLITIEDIKVVLKTVNSIIRFK